MIAGEVHPAPIVLLQISYVLNAQSNTAEAAYTKCCLLLTRPSTHITIHANLRLSVPW